MPTLYQIIRSKFKKEAPVETTIYNPLELRKGHTLRIDTLEHEKVVFAVDSLREVARKLGGTTNFFVDYDIVARPFDAEPVARRLRLVPVENPGDETHSALLLTKLAECGYDKNFHDGLAWENNKGEFTEGDAKYWRVNDLKEPWQAVTKTLRDLDGSGKIDAAEVTPNLINYWDFWRETEDEAGNKVLEFYIVEMDKDGFFEFWLGRQIDLNRISTI
jgi:hypothetical protein